MGIDGYSNAIREALNEQGTYEKRLELTIHMLACSMRTYAKLQDELSSDTFLKVELTRENDERYKMNPLFAMMLHEGEQVRKYLRELKLTKALSGKGNEAEEGDRDDNDLNNLVNAVNAAGMQLGPRLPDKKTQKN
jgi:hypothetical protein